jgi:RNA polymerase sigma-70 factor (ECF subfamily)
MCSAVANERVAEVFRVYNDTLVNYLTSRLMSRQEALEVAQEAYVRLLSMAESGKILDLESYLFRIAKNIAIDRLRRDGLKLRVFESAGVVLLLDDESSRQGVTGPESEASGRQTLKLLRAAINELPPKCRMAFILYKLQGESYKEVAFRMHLTESMVRKYVLRGLEYCRRRLGQELD